MGSKIGVSTWSIQQATYQKNMSIDAIIETIASMNVDGLDLYHEYIPNTRSSVLHELHRIVDVSRKNGLPITTTWFMCDIVSGCVAASLDAVAEEMRNYLAITAECSCDLLTIPMLFNVPGMQMEQYYEHLLRFFEMILPTAQRYNVRFAHELPRQGSPELGLRLAKALNSEYYTLCPDLEAWRLETDDIPLVHAEMEPGEKCVPSSLELFRECLPYSPSIHYKLLKLDEDGEEPHFPIRALMDAINESPICHHLAVEYEGWIPDLCPERDAIIETRRCVEMIRRYQK